MIGTLYTSEKIQPGGRRKTVVRSIASSTSSFYLPAGVFMSRVSASMTAHDPSIDTEWRAEALCATEAKTKLFFPVGVTGAAEIQIQEAKAVCAKCPVREACLNFAIATNQEYGIWGGASEEERRILRRHWRAEQRAKRQAAAAAKAAAKKAAARQQAS